jgi:ANTAR domain/GAF domain
MTDLPTNPGSDADQYDAAPRDDESESRQRDSTGGVDLVVGLRSLGADRSVAAVRLLVTKAAARLPGAVDAALTVRAGDALRTVAQTSSLPLAVDALQYEHGGPCIDAAVTSDITVHAEDLRSDNRWSAFADAALQKTPVLGVLSYRLFIDDDDDVIGSLNLYATKPHAFDCDTVSAGQRLAAHAAVVLAYAAEREQRLNLERALDSSRGIGAAIGILMARRLVTREQAFQLLQTASQHNNRKLRQVAEDVLDTGDLPVTHTGYMTANSTTR